MKKKISFLHQPTVTIRQEILYIWMTDCTLPLCFQVILLRNTSENQIILRRRENESWECDSGQFKYQY